MTRISFRETNDMNSLELQSVYFKPHFITFLAVWFSFSCHNQLCWGIFAMLALKTAIWEKFLNNQRHHLLKVHHWPWAERSCPRSTIDSSRHFQTSNWINTNNFSVNQNHTRCPQRSLIKLQANPRLFTFEIGQVNFNIFIFLDSNFVHLCAKSQYISDHGDNEEEEGKANMNC